MVREDIYEPIYIVGSNNNTEMQYDVIKFVSKDDKDQLVSDLMKLEDLSQKKTKTQMLFRKKNTIFDIDKLFF